MRVRRLRKARHRILESKRYPGLIGIGAILVALLMAASMVSVSRAGTTSLPDVTLSGGFQSGHFNDVWDLTNGDITISFTYDATGMVDDLGGAIAHAWAELGVRSQSTASDFNPYGTIYWKKTVDLMAGQNLDIGDLTIQRIDNTLYVTFEIVEDGWFMTETHVDVQDAVGKIPQTKTGNPNPGRFAYKMLHDPPVAEYQYAIDVSAYVASTKLFIAAHAAVIHISEVCVDVASDESVVWSGDEITWNPALLCYVHPSWPGIAGATWIWRTALVDPLEEYTNVPTGGWWFKKDLTLPAGAYDIVGEIQADADNGEAIYVNGNYILKDGSMDKIGPDNQEWRTIETADISAYLVPGQNTLILRALNFFDYGDGYSNPAGLVFKVHVCYKIVDQKESAWGWMTGDFDGSNWATYVTYKPTADASVRGSGVWLATDYDWTANTFDPDPVGAPNLDIDDKMILQGRGGNDEGYYDLPSLPAQYWNNYGFWKDRDGVDQWQALMWGCINGGTYNTNGINNVVITLHATSDTTATAYMTVNGVPQGFYNGPWYNGQPALYPAGLTWVGDMHHLVVFYGMYGYGATHTAVFSGITVVQ